MVCYGRLTDMDPLIKVLGLVPDAFLMPLSHILLPN